MYIRSIFGTLTKCGSIWKDLEQHIINSAIDQWRHRQSVRISAKGGHFKHSL